MRRHVLPATLLLIALSTGGAALRVEAEAQADAPAPPPAGAVAPVLTARRVPALLAEPVGDRRLAVAAADVADRAPVGSCVLVSKDGVVLAERDPDVPVIPASTLKLLTATAVLHHLDPTSRYRTPVVAAAPPVGGVVEGDVWLVGTGDPLLGTQGYFERFRRQPQLRTSLEALADSLVAGGVREVRGAVRGDEGRYDGARFVATWKPSYISENQTGPLSALTVNDGFGAWQPRIEPFADPAEGAAAVLTWLLRERGVVVAGEPGVGPVPPAYVEVAAVESPTVGEIVGQMLRESDNGTAELLVKELGVVVAGEGSTAAGVRVVAETLTSLGLPMSGVQVLDGSGLDRGNRVTCRLLHDVLTRAPSDSLLVQGLPVAGLSGTLSGRMVDSPAAGRLRGKTGSISQVGSLAGVVESPLGFRLSFAQVVNGLDQGALARQLQDELGAAMARYPELPAVAELGPRAHPALSAA